MRMWMVDPKFLCRKHLLGEHVECHMFLGTLKKKIKIDGYINKNLFEPLSLTHRHEELSNELKNRGYSHKSLLNFNISDLNYLTEQTKNKKIDKNSSSQDLYSRCPECRSRLERSIGLNNDNKPTN